MGVHLVAGHNPGPYTGGGSNTWFIDGRVPTLIDTGAGHPRHLQDLDALLDRIGTPLAQVLVTHAHPDHAGGAPLVAERWPGAVFAKYPWPDEDSRTAVSWRALADDEVVPAGDESLWVLHTPGHAPDHVCFFFPRSGTLFAGDLVMNGGTVVIPASRGGNLAQYLQSLRRILELQPRRILPGHGAAIEQPAALLRGYIAHRLARERQVVEALRGGPATVAALVERIYTGLAPDLAAAAGESVLAHLMKLEEEGLTRRDAAGRSPEATWGLV
jgi:glyoxylase-like metal-dependent hydrolase (beta-lactamase superfamily II)